ncbi:MAG: phosphatase PAP2 family protein [Verrucomicrobiales bacterium]|nr:phosphatase PAP2 family protein [Verrucomicrobiales bacterium]
MRNRVNPARRRAESGAGNQGDSAAEMLNDGLTVTDWMITMDWRLFREINTHWVNPVFDWLMPLIGAAEVMKWLLLALMVGLLWRGGFNGRVLVLLASLCVAIGDPLIINPVKHAVARPRPYQALTEVRRVSWQPSGAVALMVSNRPGKANSMPSAHVANNVTLVLAWLLVYGWRRWWWLLGWPLLMMCSRVYTGDHFPADTAAGFLLGAAYTLLICCLADKIWQNYGRRLAPKLYDKHPTLLASRRAR